MPIAAPSPSGSRPSRAQNRAGAPLRLRRTGAAGCERLGRTGASELPRYSCAGGNWVTRLEQLHEWLAAHGARRGRAVEDRLPQPAARPLDGEAAGRWFFFAAARAATRAWRARSTLLSSVVTRSGFIGSPTRTPRGRYASGVQSTSLHSTRGVEALRWSLPLIENYPFDAEEAIAFAQYGPCSQRST
ncbi:hypothetical protein [Streptomyces sp. NPDC006307]|uniref:hypothetical protein n=1 Tax=Streptomyces sp. NPDC006307 TaxID=3156748 RepID=UPI0033A601FC